MPKLSAPAIFMIAAAAALSVSTPAAAQQDSGKRQVSITVGFPAGGTYHAITMLISRHMGRHLAGNPNIIVQPKPGAGSLVAANYIANVAPKDGSALGVVGGGVILEPLFGNKKAQFDPRKLNWLGSISTETSICAVWHTSPVKTVADAQARQVVAGSSGRGSRTWTYPTAMNNTLSTKFKVIAGFKGASGIEQAWQNGEVDSFCGYGWGGIVARHPDWIRDKKFSAIAQFGYTKNKDLPDVPLILDLMKTDRDRAAMKLLVVDTYVAWPMIAPPGLSAATLASLRKAYLDTLADKALLAEADKLRFEVDPVKGVDIQSRVSEVYASPKDVIAHAKKISGL
jgi:tripartite-type tricarboxylate transporter receptor subunit TctC